MTSLRVGVRRGQHQTREIARVIQHHLYLLRSMTRIVQHWAVPRYLRHLQVRTYLVASPEYCIGRIQNDRAPFSFRLHLCPMRHIMRAAFQ